MTQLGVHYSPQIVELLNNGEVEVEYFKCPEWPDVIAQAQRIRPVYVHFGLGVGTGIGDASMGDMGQSGSRSADWNFIEGLLKDTATPYLNLHLVPMSQDYPHIPLNSDDPAHIERITAALIRDVEGVVRRFGADKVIVENIPANDTRILRIAMRPEVIQTVVQTTSCGFLLDIAHAQLTVPYFDTDLKTYLEALPVDRLREIHVSGVQMLEGEWLAGLEGVLGSESPFIQQYAHGLMDHLPMTEADWQALTWVIGRIQSGEWNTPWMAGFEYSGVGLFGAITRIDVLREQIPRLWAHVHSADAVTGG
jgi:uncharacterized protein (UPF0276 family)